MPEYNGSGIPYFDVAFAVSGDLTSVPDATQPSGTVSYTQGYGVSYSTAVTSGGYNFPRAQHNQILNDVTTLLQYLGQNGAPPFITTAMNGGSTPYSYALGAIVSYNAGSGIQNWVSTATSNTTTPGAMGASWLALGTANTRTALTTNTSYYVATTGSDSNPGTSGSPWLTIQHAINYLMSSIDLAGYTATISVAAGTYTGGVSVGAAFTGGGTVQLSGDTTTPSNVIISTTSADAIYVGNGGELSVRGFKLQTATSGGGIHAGPNGIISVNGNMNMGACYNNHFTALLPGSYISINANYTISGGVTSGSHWTGQQNGAIDATGLTITLTGTPAFSVAFAYADGAYLDVYGNTFSGSATGSRYSALNCGVINTNGGGATYLPGNSSGSGTNPGTSPYGLYL